MPRMVAWIISGLWGFFSKRMGQLILAFLAWTGLTYVAQKVVVDEIVQQIHAHVQSLEASATGQVAEMALAGLGMLKVDIAITMWLSAIGIRAGIGSLKVFLARKT